MKHLCLVLLPCLCLLLAAPSHAADANSVSVRGDVARVELVYQDGVYQQTYLYVWSDVPAQQVRPHLFRCDGNALAICTSPSTLLPCTRTSMTDTTTFGGGRTIVSYTCTETRRDAGACVDVAAHLTALYTSNFVVYSDSDERYELFEIMAMDVENVSVVASGWVSAGFDCTAKP